MLVVEMRLRHHFFFCLHARLYTPVYKRHYVCVFSSFFESVFFQKQHCDCSFVAHSCPTLGISSYSPGSKGFSEALLIGCNLLFKLESRRASSPRSLQAINARNTNTAGHNCCISALFSSLPLSHLIRGLSRGRIDSSCNAGPRCKQPLSGGAFWGKQRGRGILV